MSTGSGSGSRPDRGEPRISIEDARKYVEQLRPSPAHRIVADVVYMVLNAAQAKQGRRDARPLIDPGHRHGAAHPPVRARRGDQATRPRAGAGAARPGEREAARHPRNEPNDPAAIPTPPFQAARPTRPAPSQR